MNSEHSEVRQLACKIEAYLSDHPRAADTLTGVLQWWLVKQRYVETREKVEQALRYLVDHAKVEKRILGDGSIVYAKRTSNGPSLKDD